MTTRVTPAQVENFRETLEAHLQAHYHGDAVFAPAIEVQIGQRFARLVWVSGPQRSSYGFIDLTNGDLLKADGWKKPAKHKRGSIFNDDPLAGCDRYGMCYLR